MPDYIMEKRRKGRIPSALFSDLLRLELLIKYGGTWIDSTVLCTEENGSKFQEVPKVSSLLEADLFLFQYTPPGSPRFGGISNWFISAYSNNKVLMILRDLLLAYWKDFDCVMDYYIFHFFFEGVAMANTKEIGDMPYAYSIDALQLMKHWNDEFVQETWNQWTSTACFHKLSSRPKNKDKTDNYYNRIINNF